MATFPVLADRASGYVVPATEWNALVGTVGALAYLREGFDRLLVNADGSAMALGTVAVQSTVMTAEAVMTATAADTRRVWIAQGSIASSTAGMFRGVGLTPVRVTGTTGVGEQLCTSTTLGVARPATGAEPSFGVVVADAVGGVALVRLHTGAPGSGGALAPGSVGATELADNAVTNAKMADNSVNTAELVNLGVTNGKLAADAVTSDKIAAGALTSGDFENFNANVLLAGPTSGGAAPPTKRALVAADIPASLITSAMIADGTIVVGDLADGAVTSAKILDGTIATADVAANAITQVGWAAGSTASPTTTSATYVDIPDMTVTLTTTGGDLQVEFVGSMFNSGVGATQTCAVQLDGGADVGIAAFSSTAANYYLPIPVMWRFTGVSAGSHTVKARWQTGTGTLTNSGVARVLRVLELKR